MNVRFATAAALGIVVVSWMFLPVADGQEKPQPPPDAPAPNVEKVLVHQAPGVVILRGEQPPGQVVVPPGQPPGPGSPIPGQPADQVPPQPGGSPTQPPGKEPPAQDGETSGTVKRPDKPPEPADRAELDVRPDPDGLIRFQFRGQAWPDIMEWFGEISQMSVDWQELPGDYVNIATQRGYRIEEVRDLLNRLLLARGFTMLRQDEFLIVVKCADVSSGLVPRVAVEDLDILQPHEFVRVLFELDWILADTMAEELEPLLSANGRLSPLTSTNRIEAMDAVANLRELHRLLEAEQAMPEGEPRVVREFVLQFARADDVKELLSQFLGESQRSGMPMAGMTPEQMAMMQQQQQQQMQQQMQQQQQEMMMRMQAQGAMPGQMPGRPARGTARVRRGGTPGQTERDQIRMIVSRRRNSILVHAPPDKMAIIADAIQLLDVGEPGAQSLQAFLGRMQVYRLAQLDPRKLVDTLQQLGGLDPTTRLEVDDANRAIIAYATPADHFTIRSTVEKLDGSARRVEVIPLRRLAADEVAGTIQYLIGGSSDRDSSRSGFSDYMWGFSPGRRPRGQENSDEFRVDADVANNRLLVRANDTELEEVVSILVKLGEMPTRGSVAGHTRVLEVVPGQDADQYFQKLRAQWEAVSPHPLILPTPATDAPPATPPSAEAAPAEAAMPDERPAAPVAAAVQRFQTAVLRNPISDEAVPSPAPADQPESAPSGDSPQTWPPISVSVGPDGRLVIASRDPEALALLEELIEQTAPRAKDYQIFRLKDASATWVVLNLQDYFKDEDKADSRRRDRMSAMFFGMPSSSSAEDQRRLSNRRPLRFIADIDTNPILVQGADPAQLKTIEELIELYDVPEPVNSQKTRVTRLFTVQFSKANVIADVIKDAYRDLLSANDRSLQAANRGGPPGQQQQRPGAGMTIISPFGFDAGPSPPDNRTSARFEGKLSIGVDELTNTLLVSTEGESLMSVISDMIKALDVAAKPVSELRVIPLRSGTDASRLSQALDKVLNGNRSASPGPPPTPGGPPAGPPGEFPGPPPGAPVPGAVPKRP